MIWCDSALALQLLKAIAGGTNYAQIHSIVWNCKVVGWWIGLGHLYLADSQNDRCIGDYFCLIKSGEVQGGG